MTLRTWCACAGLAAALSTPTTPAWAWSLWPSTNSAPKAASTPAVAGNVADGADLARRLQEAARRQNYAGTFVVNTGRGMNSARMAHYNDGRHQIDRLELLDGHERLVFRQPDSVQVIWPRMQRGVLQPREPFGNFPVLWPNESIPPLDQYEVAASGTDRVAGWETAVWTFSPRDASRYGMRLWVEPQSNLLVRADTLNERGEIIESSAYTDLQIGVKPQVNSVQQELQRLRTQIQVARPPIENTDLGREGWSFTSPIPGFQVVRCTKRLLRHTPNDRPQGDSGAEQFHVLQTFLSDGLSHVSLFIEPYDAGRHKRNTPAALGATQALSQRQGDWWITAVGDAPALTLQKFMNAMERRKP